MFFWMTVKRINVIALVLCLLHFWIIPHRFGSILSQSVTKLKPKPKILKQAMAFTTLLIGFFFKVKPNAKPNVNNFGFDWLNSFLSASVISNVIYIFWGGPKMALTAKM